MASTKKAPGPQPPDIQPPQSMGGPKPPEDDEPTQAPAPPPGPTQGELDEALEDNLNLQAENARLKANMEEMNARLARMERLMQGKAAYTPDPAGVDREAAGVEPLFDDEASFGTIWGDTEVAFMQNGHYFGPDKRFVRSERKEQRGSPRPFKPQLVGLVVRPRVREAA